MAEINLFRILDRGKPTKLKYTDSVTCLDWFKPFKVAEVALQYGTTDDFAFNWQNPENVQIMIHLVAVNLTAASGAASTMDIGTATAVDVASLNIIEQLNINTTGWFNSYTNHGTGGVPIQVVDANGGTTDFVTGQILDAAGDDLAGTVYIIYTTLDF